MSIDDNNSADSAPVRFQWIDIAAVALLIATVSTIYGVRLSRLPIVGEESRWGTAAREMLSSGDWIVTRQQGHVFSERPPMTVWAIAAVGWLRGEVDPIAVRLPSVVAVVLTTLLIYGYGRMCLSRFAAWTGALVYASMAQVVQIGRMGESEALFALLVSASLLLWHLGYLCHWRPLLTWSMGFGFAALAALVKGPQAPVYFVAIVAVYLILRRDWRYFLSWQAAAGSLLFFATVLAWQIPFYLATDWKTSLATWTGLTQDRLYLSGLATHLALQPLETFACLMPWSPLLIALASRKTRTLVASRADIVRFLLIGMAVAYPSVWIAAGGRGRYFMPLYPCVALLIALVIDRCSMATQGDYPRRAWHQFLLLSGTLIVASGLVCGGASVLDSRWAQVLCQPRWFGFGYAVAATVAAYALWRSYRSAQESTRFVAITAIAGMVGLAATGLMINVHMAHWNDLTEAVAELKEDLPPGAKLVSLSPIEHRFAFYYGAPITQLDWPTTIDELPSDVEYFCFMRNPGDSARQRMSGRGRSWTTTPGTLPFAWEEIASIYSEREISGDRPRSVVLGRVVRPLRAEVTDVTVPRGTISRQPLAASQK
jgi:4-amino-4-deoxy-L-arabinose transferase-like glycosyltransferase